MKPPSRLWQVLAVLGVVILAVVVCLTVPGPGKRPENLFRKPQKAPEEIEEIKKKAPNLPFELTEGRAEFGNPEAAVKVTAFIPGGGGCGNETAVFLHQVAQANKDRLRLEVVDFESQTGSAYQEELGLHCAGLVINGKQRMETTDESGKPVTLDFTTNFGESYAERELFLALDQEFERAYGDGEKCKRVVAKLEEAPGPHVREVEPTAERPPPTG